jgi:hypothetical protein
MKELHVLSLGAGVQSTTLYLMSMRGEVHRFDAAVFADTQEEPEAVYLHLDWLRSLNGPPILTGTAGKLGDDLQHGGSSLGHRSRFAAIPAYTTADHGKTHGRTKRQCSKEYKSDVIGRIIRRELLGLQPGRGVPNDVLVYQYFGITIDEAGRAGRIRQRFGPKSRYRACFPFIDSMTARANCKDRLIQFGVPHEVPRSACTFCPFHTDAEWQALRDRGGADWDRAIEVDEALRGKGAVAGRHMEQVMFLHRSCRPLRDVVFQPRASGKDMQLGFALECEGMCGV